ncbi:hypothetical protein MRB53_004241 [Persea americana]|uniref:Uncharacterized protein n=1 Tax=Persea americana TaxID=3435 RepID=A0ACC2MAP3_PERAE|nr:hypothetical protein MRB53_004241 [Persea americana]
MATRKMQPTADLFNLPKNTVTKKMNAPDIEKLKQIYEVEGNAVDCKVIVCYLMKQLTHKQVIASKLSQSVVDGLRAEIVSKFLNDTHRSWSIENFHARQQSANDDFEQ